MMAALLPPRPADATLSVTKAARLLGVHPNTIRAWSDAGRLRYYRINSRGDRRYRVGDLQRFLAAASAGGTEVAVTHGHGGARRGFDPAFGRGIQHRAAIASAPAAITDGDGLDVDRRRAELDVLAQLAALATEAANTAGDLDSVLDAAADALRDTGDYYLVAIWELRGDDFVPRAV